MAVPLLAVLRSMLDGLIEPERPVGGDGRVRVTTPVKDAMAVTLMVEVTEAPFRALPLVGFTVVRNFSDTVI